MWLAHPDSFVSDPEEPPNGTPEDAMYFVEINGQLLSIIEGGTHRPITADEFRWVDVEVLKKMHMGTWRGVHVYAIEAKGTPPHGFILGDLRSWLGRVESSMFYLAGRAKQIIDWNRDHAYCGRCGTRTVDHTSDRAKQCLNCGLINYPRLSPSIIVLVCRDDEMLLARNAQWRGGMYSTLAGFVEPGESIEQTVHREILEEVGILVKDLKYLGSQPWPFPNSLMLGFHASYKSGDIVCNDEEVAEARWFHYSHLPNVPGGVAISRWLIDSFVDERKKVNGS